MLNNIVTSLFCIFSLATTLALDNCENIDSEHCYNEIFYAKNYDGIESRANLEDAQILLSHGAEVRRSIPYESKVRYGSREGDRLDNFGDSLLVSESEETRRTVPHQSNIPYGPSDEQRLDIYGDDLPQDAKIFVLIHGGDWSMFNKDDSSFIAKPLYEIGVRTIVPNFDLAPKATMTTIVSEIKEMADYVLALAEQYNSRGVWFGGHSSGGHLASQLLTDEYLNTLSENKQRLINGYVLLSGVYDLTSDYYNTLNETLHLTREEVQQYSPLLQPDNFNIVKKLGPKVLLVMAQYDIPQVLNETPKFRMLLTNYGIDVTFMEIGNENHYTSYIKIFYKNFVLTRAIIAMLQS